MRRETISDILINRGGFCSALNFLKIFYCFLQIITSACFGAERKNGRRKMKFRSFIAVIIAAVLLTACSGVNEEQKAADEALHQRLIGVWVYLDSVEKDDNGNILTFSAYQFDEEISKVHDVMGGQIMSSVLDKYEIEDGYYSTIVDGAKQYAKLEITEEDGRDRLHWIIDTGTLEFAKMSDEEISEYGIPVDKMITGEAEMLGIETTASE